VFRRKFIIACTTAYNTCYVYIETVALAPFDVTCVCCLMKVIVHNENMLHFIYFVDFDIFI